jgi:hypothetical protein
MKFMIKSIASTALGYFGSWLGGLINIETSLVLGFVLSIVGWYLTKNWIAKQGL